MKAIKEIWIDVLGFEAQYKISNLGRCKQKNDRWVKCGSGNRFIKAKMLKANTTHYPVYGLWNGKTITKQIHILVATHFIDNPNNYKIVNHIDGNIQNYHASNLEWCTPQENAKHGKSKIKYSIRKSSIK